MRKSTIKKLLFIVLSLILVLAAVSCMPEKKEDDKNDDVETNPNAIETLDPNQALNVSEYVIVRSDLAKKAVKDATAALRKGIQEKTGVDVKIITDMKGEVSKEILVGASKRISSDGIMLDQFKITRVGSKIAIVGGTDEQTAKGVEFFVENLVSDTGLLLADGYSYATTSNFSVLTLKVGSKDIYSVGISFDSDGESFADSLTELMSTYVGLPVEQVKKTENANVIITSDSSLGVKEGSWAVLTKDGKIYLVGKTYYELKAAYDYFAETIRGAKGDLALDDGVLKSEKLQTKEEFYDQTQLVIYPELPTQIRRNYDYKVSVTQGDKTATLPVYNHTMEYTDYSRGVGGDYYRRYSMFAFSGERVRVDIKVSRDFSYYTVMPSAKEFETTFENGVISVYLDKPDYFMIRLDEDDNSIISVAADYPEYPGDIPEKGAPGVTYIEGWYETENGLFELTETGAQLYIAPGAVLNARCKVTGNNSRITGRGVIVDPFENIHERDIRDGGTEGSGWKMMSITGDGTYFDGITFMDARCFNLAVNADNVQIYNYKAFSTMMTTDGLSLFGGKDAYVEHLMLYVADNTFVYSVKSGYVKDAICGTTCATLFPQGTTANITFEKLYVMRSSDGFINNSYNPDAKDRTHGSNLIDCDAVDCINLPHFFRGRGMGTLEKTFTFTNISLPKLTAKNNPHGLLAGGFSNRAAERLFYVINSDEYILTNNYHITLTNVYVNGVLIEDESQMNTKAPYYYYTIENDRSYSPVKRITHDCDYVSKGNVFVGSLQVTFEHDVVKQDGKYYLPADAILKQLRVPGESIKTTDIGGIKYICETDLAKCSAVEDIESTNSSIVITPKAPRGNLLLEDEGEISYYSEATSYTVDMVLVEEDGELVYYMYDHGKYYKPGIARTITNDIKMYGAGTYTLSFEAKAPAVAEITATVRHDTEPALNTIISQAEEIDSRWAEISVSFTVTEAMLENTTGIYFTISLTREVGDHEWFAARNITLTK